MENVPIEIRKSRIVNIYKNKNDKFYCSNCGMIALTTAVSKVLVHSYCILKEKRVGVKFKKHSYHDFARIKMSID